jgi:hypothetical protein
VFSPVSLQNERETFTSWGVVCKSLPSSERVKVDERPLIEGAISTGVNQPTHDMVFTTTRMPLLSVLWWFVA